MNELERLTQAGRAGVRVGVAESLTSGLLCSEIGKGADAGTWFAGGIVAYLGRTKEQLLGLIPGRIPARPPARCIAIGARELLDADVSVATTGVGGPHAENSHAPGTVYLGWATAAGSGQLTSRWRANPMSSCVRRSTRHSACWRCSPRPKR